jgi:hypothetical protein
MTDKESEVSPDSLMAHFHGSGLKKIIAFTIAVHVVVLGASSVPFLWKSAFRGDVSKLDKDQRMAKAVADASASLRKIAAENGLDPQEISRRFAGGGATRAPAPPPVEAAASNAPPPEAKTPPAEPEKPKSAIEKELEVKTPGPDVPPVGSGKDDIF